MFDFGYGGSSHFQPSQTYGRVRGSSATQGVAYPSPFFDLAHTYLPPTVKQMFKWCRYYYLTQPLIAAVVNKMAEYPITDLVIDTDNRGVRNLWERFFESGISLRSRLLDIGLYYFCYGNALGSMMHPFIKWLKCKYCGHTEMAKKATYRFRTYEFHLNCKKCGQTGQAQVEDQYLTSSSGTKILLWNPEDIDIVFNPITQETEYFYSLPIQTLNDMAVGRREIIEQLPQVFIDAAKKRKSITLNKDNLFHIKRPSVLSGPRDTGWGTPLVLPVLKDVFYLQIMKKAQECVSPSTLIETEKGLIPADDVKIGDRVRTHTGEWHEIEKKWYRSARDEEVGRKIAVTGLRPFSSIYSPGHPLFTIRRNEEGRRIDTREKQQSSVILKNPHLWQEVLCPAEQIEIGDYLLHPRKLPTENQLIDVAEITGLYSEDGWVYSGGCSDDTASSFAALERGEQVDHDNAGRVAKRCLTKGITPKRFRSSLELTDDLAYILGWYVGDGSTGTGHVTISLGPDDDPSRLIRSVESVFGLPCSVKQDKKSQGKTLDFCDVIITKLIKGLVPGRAREKSIPICILNGSDSTKLSFLAGLWGADGWVGTDRMTLATSSKDLAYDSYRMLIHLGCIATVGPHHNPGSLISTTGQWVKESDGFHVSVHNASKDRLIKLWAENTAPEVISGKSGFFWKGYFASRVCAVEEIEEDTYIDFVVEKDTTFCTPGTATKNSILLERIVPLTVIFPQQSSGTADPYCVSHDTLIETRDGLKPAVEVTDRDFVKTHSGIWRRVEHAVDRKVRNGEKVFKITAASLSAFPFEVSEDHPILSVRKADSYRDHMPGEPSWIKAKDLSEGDFVCYPTKRSEWRGEFSLDLADFNPERAATTDWIYRRLSQKTAEIYEFFEENGIPEFSRKGLPKNDQPLNRFCEEHGWTRNDYEVARVIFWNEPGVDRMPRFLFVTEELAFLVGLYAAEGSRKDTLASFALNVNEGELVDRIDAYLQSLGCSPVSRSVRGSSLDVGINDVLISSVLFSCGCGAVNKRLPRFITEAPRAIALEAVNGVICGDECDFMASSGRGKKSLRRIGLKTISPQLAMDVRAILLSVEVLATVQKATPKPDEIAKADYYQVNTNGAAAERLADLLGRPHKESPSGRSSGFFRDGYVYLRVKKIEDAPDVKVVRGFQVDGDKSFCVAGVATHNTSVNLIDWKEHIAQEIQRWRLDRNYIPILPLPIGNQVIGGDGRALLMSQEIKIWSDQIIAGMGVPNEFIYGGLQWSGSNVSLRMLENQFLRYLSGLLIFIKDFVIKGMAAHMGWPEVGIRFKPFKMADDLQRKAFLFQLNQAKIISDTTLLTDTDLNPDEENELIKKETKARLEAVKTQQIAEAEIAGEAGVINAKYQAKAQSIMAQEQQQSATGSQGTAPGEPGEAVGAVPVQISTPPGQQQQQQQQQNPMQSVVQRLRALSPDAQRSVLMRIEQSNPNLANQLRAEFKQGGGIDPSPNTSSAGLPLPSQLPPRRGPESAMI